MGKRNMLQNDKLHRVEIKRKEVEKKYEYRGIRTLIKKGHYDLAIVACEEFLQKYPGNSYVLKDYASIVRQQGSPEGALELLSNCQNEGIHNIRERALCYAYMGEYQQALETICNIRCFNDKDKSIVTFCKAKLGKYSEDDSACSCYDIKQAISYDEKVAIEHIKSSNEAAKEANYYCYNEEIDIEQLYYNLQKILPEASPIVNDSLMTKYLFRMQDVGYLEGERTNVLAVTTFPNSFDIMTMIPSFSYPDRLVVNNYDQMLLQKREQKQIKALVRESQIDKFNQRYNRK